MAKRTGISKRLRFEVFKRDSFKCQYCGKGAPEVVLHIDHIAPAAKGGRDELVNLITACVECNAGKSDIALSDDSAVQKQRRQLEDLNERREQLEMMLKWRKGLAKIHDRTLDAIAQAWKEAVPGWHLNETGMESARRLLAKHGLENVLGAIEVARNTYIRIQDGKATKESVELAWRKVPGIIAMQAEPQWRRDLYYVRGILRNRLSYVNERMAMRYLEEAVELGVGTEYLKQLAKDCRSWSQFEHWMIEVIAEAGAPAAGDQTKG